MAALGGWTGKTLRVNLTTGAITTEDTIAKYKDYLGGTGLAYKVLWDEVPPGTTADSPDNRIIFGVGPLTGSGSPCTGRVSITTLWPNQVPELPGTGHMGGHWGPELKYAGYDSLIIQGKAASPVWIKIVDDKVTIEDASTMWGKGIFNATAQIEQLMGTGCHVAAIGQAAENGARISSILCDRSHSGGGGFVMGAKNLKAIGVKGSGSLKIAADKTTWRDFNYKFLSYMGANNNGVVPKTQQPWAEYYNSGTRWAADKGILWGANANKWDTGYCPDFEGPTYDGLKPQNKMGMRTHKGHNDYSTMTAQGVSQGVKYTVKMNGCHACPVRCHIATNIPTLQGYGAPSNYNQNTCLGNSVITGVLGTNPTAGYPKNVGVTDPSITQAMMSNAVADDYGIWSDYGLFTAVYGAIMKTKLTQGLLTLAGDVNPSPWVGKTVFQKYLSAAELTLLSGSPTGDYTVTLAPSVTPNAYAAGTPWRRADDGDPSVLLWFAQYFSSMNAEGSQYPRSQGYQLGYMMLNGPARMAQAWPEVEIFLQHFKSINAFKMDHIKHHGVENGGQVGCLNGLMWNRDPMNHTHTNYYGNGLPLSIQQDIGKELFTGNNNSIFTAADDGIGGVTNYSALGPMSPAKASVAARIIVTLELHNSLTCCNYQLPVWASPLARRNYRGDDTMDAQAYSLVTGETITQKQLETTGLRILTLFRALTARHMEYYINQADASKHVNMRTDHDYLYPWMYENKYSPINVQIGNNDCYGALATGNTNPPSADYVVGSSTQGQLMGVNDMEYAKDLLYGQFGWDLATGMPTSATLSNLGLGYVQAAIPNLIKE